MNSLVDYQGAQTFVHGYVDVLGYKDIQVL
jgi:hypothetical protein